MKALYALVLSWLVALIFFAPFGMIISGLIMKYSWWVRLAMVGGGLLLGWMIKPISIITGKDLRII